MPITAPATPRHHIAMLLPTLRGGGAERNFLRLAGHLLDLGHRVTLIVAKTEGPNDSWIPAGTEVVDLRVRMFQTTPLALARAMRRLRPTILLSALTGTNVSAVAGRSLARGQFPIVVTERNTLTVATRGLKGFQHRYLIPWLAKRLYPRAEAIVGVSRGVADDLARFLRVSSETVLDIPNPIVDERLLELASRPVPQPWDTRLGGGPLVLSVGRLIPHKGLDVLIRGFGIVKQRVPEAQLAILGDGDHRVEIERLTTSLGLDDSVLMAGFQDNPYAWMSRASTLVLASRWEGLPTVLIEALACGARVVATDCPSGPSEILENGRWGSLVPVDDHEELARAIIESLELGRWPEPPEGAISRYRPDVVVPEYVSLIDKLIANS